jgi:predicted nucleotidyltransferase
VIPKRHKEFVDNASAILEQDSRIAGLALGGSWVSGQMDEYSDLDFVIVVSDDKEDEICRNRTTIAESLGDLINCFTGEHVGEPRLLICLYNDPPLHVDLVFKSVSDFSKRVEDPLILWERDNLLSKTIEASTSFFPSRSLQWMEDRFWTWVHYCALKLGRGELFEFIDGTTFMRSVVIGPLLLRKYGMRPVGVRRAEFAITESEQGHLSRTIASNDPKSCFSALKEMIVLYQMLREYHQDADLIRRERTESASIVFLDSVATKIGLIE